VTPEIRDSWPSRGVATDVAADEALRRMLDGGFRHLPVMDDDRIVGMISMRDLSRVQVQAPVRLE